MYIEELNTKKHQKSITVTMSYEEIRDISNGLYYFVNNKRSEEEDTSRYAKVYSDCKLLFDMLKHGNVQPETIRFKSELLDDKTEEKSELKKTMTVREYNKEFLPKIDTASNIIMNIEQDLRKTEDFEGAMRELKVLGWSEETKETILTALEYYRKHEGIDRLKIDR